MSQFITQGDIVRDQFDWGEAGWVSRPELTGSRGMCVMDVTLQPGAGHPFHRHPDQEEIIWVREGRIEQWLEDAKHELGPGEAVYIEKDVVHGSYTVGDEPAKLTVILTPTAGEGRLRGHRRLRGGALGVAALRRELGSSEQPLEVLRGAFEVDRVSVARIDLEASRFEITADVGAKLLAPGTELPLSTCSYFAQVSEGRAFHDEDFDASDAFDRPLDSIVLLTGFHCGCSVPLRADGRVVGALSLSATASHRAMSDFAGELERLGPALAPLLGVGVARAQDVALTGRERELLAEPRGGPALQADRAAPGHQRGDGQDPRAQPLSQARRDVARRGRARRPRARPDRRGLRHLIRTCDGGRAARGG